MELSHMSSDAIEAADFGHGGPIDSSPLSQSNQQGQLAHIHDIDNDHHAPSNGNGRITSDPRRSESVMSQSQTLTPSRGGTLKKRQSLSRKVSQKQNVSRRNSYAGSEKGLVFAEGEKHRSAERDELNSAFFTPVPTTGNPTEILANRFQAWRKVLKDLITYFRDIQKSYESRAKSLLGVSNIINNISVPPILLTEGGISDAAHILRDYHKQALAEGNKARNIEEDVIIQLTGLRGDLQQKIKEIKNLSGDFKNSVEKETEGTRRAVRGLQEALGMVDTDPSATSGRGDPFIVKLGVDRQVERQIEEENYLHRAFLNLENSGRELESIVVGEIQKAYNAYAGIIKREADEAYDAVEKLRNGPIGMPKDKEWDAFVDKNEHFVDPRLPVRNVERIHYPGKDHPAAAEVRGGLLERKSKYLKSYTAGWYVLSPTHLHEFKSAERINAQAPIMSLYLPDQKLGSHSGADSSSHKFMLKGRQTGTMHRGHAWVFRAESHDTMLAWYEDIKNLTEKTGEERNAFVRRHARSVSGGSHKAGSVSEDGAMDEDEADAVPYSAHASQVSQTQPTNDQPKERPQPGGRFPSDLNVSRDLQVPTSPSSGASSEDRGIVAAAGALPGSGVPFGPSGRQVRIGDDETTSVGMPSSQDDPFVSPANGRHFKREEAPGFQRDMPYDSKPTQPQEMESGRPDAGSYGKAQPRPPNPLAMRPIPQEPARHDSTYGEWMAPAAASRGELDAGILGTKAYQDRQKAREHDSDLLETQLASPSEVETMRRADSKGATKEGSIGIATSESYLSRAASRTDPSLIGTSSTVPTSAGVPDENPSPSKLYMSGGRSPGTTQIFGSSTSHIKSEVTSLPGGDMALKEALPARPRMPNHSEVKTASDLHIPGEYPRGSIVMGSEGT